MLTLLIFAVLLVLIMMNLPIAVAMGLTAVAFFAGLGDSSLLTMLPQRMYASTTGFTLLAIPFFILAGNLMNTGGVTSRIFRFAKAVVGHVPGGLGQVCVIANVIFSGMSGSAIADAAGLGQVLHKAMVDNGFKPKFSAAIVAVGGHDRPGHSPQHPLCSLRRTDRGVGRQALPGRLYPRGADGHCHDDRHRLSGEAL